MPLIETLSPRSTSAPESGIVEVFKYGMGREGLIPLWAGEGDSPTPDFISRAAADALIAGETFYTYQRGIPDLRQALARYYARHFGTSLNSENFFVTASGMHAIKIAAEMIAAPGDEMIYLTPSWPNISAALEVSGAIAKPLQLEFVGGAWKLDLNKLESAIGPKTRGIFINTPSNPTGWTATLDDLRAILDIARRKGLWIMADEIYAHFHYNGGRAASFLDVMQADDRIIFVNSFSKNWSMTGWRVGWVVVPEELGQVVENLIQYSTSGVAQFMQRGATVALEEGDHVIRENFAKAAKSRDILCDALIATNRVETLKPDGAFYAFLKIDGVKDSRLTALDIVDKALVGLAPGTAFGPGGSAFIRACFLRDPAQMEVAADRLAKYIASL
ncbi:pyridoxal phosphate-dependent aminotransferase [Rhizobium sp. C1]|uniref:pyridoxal phosphate-dependent aminotransferase n=1 Tax=Rhizobium sp. C1 TaxID=1349799 RepID=UPI001E2DA7E2|nr:pyridoxal phosphate-dependent aminotransferase [Rhizobium sp. C1]MCD2178860.1 pyridoxal phosphate-dependent aminotransferase [Rhizobium sp. C1]